MKINIMTIFPEMFVALESSMLGKAMEKGIIELNLIDIRKYTEDKHNRVDDTPYGGGAGMVMQVQPIISAYQEEQLSGPTLYMSPRGELLSGELAESLSSLDEITILCGHYEGVDQRALDILDAREVSIGDYVLTGGELPAMVVVDTLARFIDGVLSSEESVKDESIYSGLLEAPHYTKPRVVTNPHMIGVCKDCDPRESCESCESAVKEILEVPEILLSGNHRDVELWRWEQALELTKTRRPDLFNKYIDSLGLHKVHGRKNGEYRMESNAWNRKLSKQEQAIIEKYIDK